MKVRKGPRLTNKSNKNPYYIELSNTYSLLAEFSANPSQTYQTTSTESKFKLNAAIRFQDNMNNQINKYIIKARYNDAAIINTTIKLAGDECKVMNKPTIRQRDQVDKAFSTAAIQSSNSITCDGKHIQFKIRPSIATYQQHDNTPMLTYDSGADGHYLRKKD